MLRRSNENFILNYMQCSFTCVPFVLLQYLLPILCSVLVINVLFDYDKKGEKRRDFTKRERYTIASLRGRRDFTKKMELTLNERMKNNIKGEFISNALN